MKISFIFLCSLFTFLCVLPQQVEAQEFEWAQMERNKRSPAREIYERVEEERQNRAEEALQRKLKTEEEYKRLEAEQGDTFAKIEEKLIAFDVDGAKAVLKESPIHGNGQLYDEILKEIEAIFEFSKASSNFFELAVTKGQEAGAIANYSSLVTAYNYLPKGLHISDQYLARINSSIDKAEKFVKKECGDDYGQIRVGMKLARVQKCVGEFFLRGQVKGKYGVVDEYGRGNTYLFVKKGKVVAWGD